MPEKPSSEQILATLVGRSTLTPEEVQTAALDVMHFVVSCLDSGAEFGVRWRGGQRFKPVNFFIPGVTTEQP